jgi:hypothetical protein
VPAPPAPAARVPAICRWKLEAIRDTFAWLKDYTLSGVWRLLQRHGLRLRSARVQQFSPDPDYAAKVADLEMALWEARRYPRSVVAVFLDQMGFTRWPDPAADWGTEPSVADRRGAKQGLWRLMGALNPFTGQVNYLDNYIVGRAKVIECYGQLVEAYPRARRLYAIQDNWSIHKHEEVIAALKGWPQIEPVWLPTYAPWGTRSRSCGAGCGRTCCICTDWRTTGRPCGSACATSWTRLPTARSGCWSTWGCRATVIWHG